MNWDLRISIPRSTPPENPTVVLSHIFGKRVIGYEVQFEQGQYHLVGIQVYVDGYRILPATNSPMAWYTGNAQTVSGSVNKKIFSDHVIIKGYNNSIDYPHGVRIMLQTEDM